MSIAIVDLSALQEEIELLRELASKYRIYEAFFKKEYGRPLGKGNWIRSVYDRLDELEQKLAKEKVVPTLMAQGSA